MTSPPPGFDPNINPKAAAKAAKAYAKANRPWFKKPGIIALIAVAVLIVIIIASKGGSDSGSTNAADGSGSAAAQDVAVEVDAASPLAEYKDNELSADQKYKGKNIAVSGVVDKVDSEVFNSKAYVLRIADGADFVAWTVNCHDIPNDKLAPVKPGDNVTVIGTVKSGGTLGVEMEDCSLR